MVCPASDGPGTWSVSARACDGAFQAWGLVAPRQSRPCRCSHGVITTTSSKLMTSIKIRPYAFFLCIATQAARLPSYLARRSSRLCHHYFCCCFSMIFRIALAFYNCTLAGIWAIRSLFTHSPLVHRDGSAYSILAFRARYFKFSCPHVCSP